MNDDTDKLAAEINKMQPSKRARNRGMNAAMAAFDMEFAAENSNVENMAQDKAANEINSSSPQGLTDETRPTGQSTNAGFVQIFGRRAMSTLSNIFNMKPKAVMMGSTCMAALLAAIVILPSTLNNMPLQEVVDKPAQSIAAEPAPMAAPTIPKRAETTINNERASVEKTVEQVRLLEIQSNQSAAPSPAADMAATPTPAPKAQSGITSVNNLLNKVRRDGAQIEAENQAREQAFRQRKSQSSQPLALGGQTPNAIGDIKTLDGNASSGGNAVPMVEKRITRRVVKTPASTQERVIPPVTKMATRRVQMEDGSYKTVSEPVVVQEASTVLVTIPATFETVTETILVPANDKFEAFEPNPVIQVSETPVSTFSIDVDTASYSFLRASLNRGQLPPPSAIRLEEMINYFPYDYDAPTSAAEPFKANVTVTETPWNADTRLMHIGIKGYVPPADEKPRSNLVFLIDTSGSMNQSNKLPLLINSFKLLLNTLDADDTVSIVTYAGSAGTVLEPTAASDKHTINAALQRLRAGGSTAGAAGLELAYQKAQESFDDEGVNRIILATDGDFNVGFSSPDAMTTFIKKKRETGIFLSVLGFGAGNYNDHLMQSLAQNGNGVAAYIDTLSEANKVLANEAGSALFTIAKDVKIQVEFNPDTISEYRLIGYENRALKREDFNNDKVDAGEIGAGHTVTAIYELTPVGSPAAVIDPLRYVTDKLSQKSAGSNELAFVKIRHKLPKADKSTLQTFPIGPKQERSLKRASDDMRFAAAVAAAGQKLRGDTQLADFSYDEAIKLASSAKGDDEHGYRSEFIQLMRLAESLQE